MPARGTNMAATGKNFIINSPKNPRAMLIKPVMKFAETPRHRLAKLSWCSCFLPRGDHSQFSVLTLPCIERRRHCRPHKWSRRWRGSTQRVRSQTNAYSRCWNSNSSLPSNLLAQYRACSISSSYESQHDPSDQDDALIHNIVEDRQGHAEP